MNPVPRESVAVEVVGKRASAESADNYRVVELPRESVIWHPAFNTPPLEECQVVFRQRRSDWGGLREAPVTYEHPLMYPYGPGETVSPPSHRDLRILTRTGRSVVSGAVLAFTHSALGTPDGRDDYVSGSSGSCRRWRDDDKMGDGCHGPTDEPVAAYSSTGKRARYDCIEPCGRRTCAR